MRCFSRIGGGGGVGKRVKQVRFGKLAFLQLYGAIFHQENMSIFGHVALGFQEIGALVWKLCTFLCRYLLDRTTLSLVLRNEKHTSQNQTRQ